MQKYLDFFSYYRALHEANEQPENTPQVPAEEQKDVKKLTSKELDKYYTWTVTSTDISNRSTRSTSNLFKNFLSYLTVINGNKNLSNLFGSKLIVGPTAVKIAGGDKTIVINTNTDVQGNETKSTLESIFQDMQFRNANAKGEKANMKIQPFIDGNVGVFLDVNPSLGERINTAVFYLLAFNKINEADNLTPIGNVYCFGVNFKQTSVFSKVFSAEKDASFLLSLFKPMNATVIASKHFSNPTEVKWVNINEEEYVNNIYAMNISLPFQDPNAIINNNQAKAAENPQKSSTETTGGFTEAQAQTTAEYIINNYAPIIFNNEDFQRTFRNLFLSDTERKVHALVSHKDELKKLSSKEFAQYKNIEKGIQAKLEVIKTIKPKLTFYKAVGNDMNEMTEALNIEDPNSQSLGSNRAKVYIELEFDTNADLSNTPVLFSTRKKLSKKGQNFLAIIRNNLVKVINAKKNIKIKDNGYVYEVYAKIGSDNDLTANSNTHGFFTIVLGKSAGKAAFFNSAADTLNTVANSNYSYGSKLNPKNRSVRMRR